MLLKLSRAVHWPLLAAIFSSVAKYLSEANVYAKWRKGLHGDRILVWNANPFMIFYFSHILIQNPKLGGRLIFVNLQN